MLILLQMPRIENPCREFVCGSTFPALETQLILEMYTKGEV